MTTKGKVVTGLASLGIAAGAWFPASAGADICVTICGGGGGEQGGLTTAVTTIVSSPGADDAAAGETAIFDRLAGNHNETVLSLV